ncbi:hypothetical protein FI667_g13698, partial [Globisporangium splendens]
MLLSGPSDWSEVDVASVGGKANLLQHGTHTRTFSLYLLISYHLQLRMAAMPLGGSVVITKYANAGEELTQNQALSFFEEAVEQPVDHLRLHPVEDASKSSPAQDAFRFAAWSRGEETQQNLLAIASASHVELWEVSDDAHICATLVGRLSVRNVRGVVWNAKVDILLVHTERDLKMVDATQPQLRVRDVFSLPSEQRNVWKTCAWSPCGLSFSAVSSSVVHTFSWSATDSAMTSKPQHEQFDLSRQKPQQQSVKFGSIAALVRVSPRLKCIERHIRPRYRHPEQLKPTAQYSRQDIVEHEQQHFDRDDLVDESGGFDGFNLGSDVLARDSSIQHELSSGSESTTDVKEPTKQPTHARPTSHLVILCRPASGESMAWEISHALALPNLPTPDLLILQATTMRFPVHWQLLIGGTLTNRLVVAHLSNTDAGWDAGISGELELPSSHVCRGLFLGERSPFLQVASTEKVKRSVFFHAAASGPQRVQLSKFKVPRRPRAGDTSTFSAQSRSTATASSDDNRKTAERPGKEDKKQEAGPPQQQADLLATLVSKLDAMQLQLNTRFDSIQTQLEQLSTRMEQLEARQNPRDTLRC